MEADREIRIFVSSTFRDFFSERELLVKQVFPALSHICEERSLTLTEIDLRTGITHEQSDEGHVLRICLEEIDRCKYFVCLLGERYGWSWKADGSQSDDLLAKTIEIAMNSSQAFTWIKDHRTDSVTELEIRHAFLNHHQPPRQCFFYFRDQKYLERLSEKDRTEFEENARCLQERQHALKKEIRQHPLAVVRAYLEPKEVVDMMHQDLLRCIEADFPAVSLSDNLVVRERDSHNSFARSRAKLFIGRADEFALLNQRCQQPSEVPIVISAESGSGKTSLLANWSSSLFVSDSAPKFSLVVRHFLGSSPQSAHHLQIIQRLLNEIKVAFSLDRDVPTQPEQLLGVFREWISLSVAQDNRSVLWILDGISELEDIGNSRSLDWLPDVFPKRFRVIISAVKGDDIHQRMAQKGWVNDEIALKKLTDSQLKDVISGFLTRYNKGLTTSQLSHLLSNNFVSNPLFLVTVLKEVRLLGSFIDFNDQLRYYFSASSIPELFQKVLARMEKDYNIEGLNLVAKYLSALWTSRRGLTEHELTEYLGLPRRTVSPFFLAVESLLVNRSGMLSFFHQHFRQAVELRYIADEPSKLAVASDLADFFLRRKEVATSRVAEEAPTLLLRCRRLEVLRGYLVSLSSFRLMYSSVYLKRDLFSFWNSLADHDMVQSYLKGLETFEAQNPSPKDYVEMLQLVAKFFSEKGEFSSSLDLHKRCLKIAEGLYEKEDPKVVSLLFSFAEVYGLNYDLNEQRPLLEEILRIHQQRLLEATAANIEERTADVAKTYEALAEHHRKIGNYDQALAHLEKAVELECGDVIRDSNKRRLMTIHHNKAIIFRRTRKTQEAKQSFETALDLAFLIEGKESLEAALIQRDFAFFWCDSGCLEEAAEFLEKAHRVFLVCYGPKNLITKRILEIWGDVKSELARGGGWIKEHQQYIRDSDEENPADDREENTGDSDAATEEPEAKRQKMMEPSRSALFTLGNLHERLELRKRTRIESAHFWTVFLEPASKDFQKLVRTVVIELHPTFVRSRFTFSTRKRDRFEVRGQGWGMFEVTVRLKLRHRFHPRELQLVHVLSFNSPLTQQRFELVLDSTQSPNSVSVKPVDSPPPSST